MKYVLTLLLMIGAAVAQAPTDDPVLQAMSAEMKRSQERLRLAQEKVPYYIEYSLSDQDAYQAEAAMGASRGEVRIRARMFRVFVRVGDRKMDNSMPWSPLPGAIELGVVDDDVLALRHSLWLATDKAYKNALQQYSAKEAMKKQFESVTPIDDFAAASPTTDVRPLAKLEGVSLQWAPVLERMTAPARREANVQEFSGNARLSATNKYFVNSEGSVTRQGQTLFEVRVEGSTQAADGMSLELSKAHVWLTPAEVMSVDKLEAESKELITTLLQLRDAPVVDDQYRGPVLLSTSAAGTVVSNLIGDNILGRRPRLGETARVRGAFANDLKARVLPDTISVVDDPTATNNGGRLLAGAYTTDDEGVKAQRVTVIDKGVLVAYLLGRTPIKDFQQSNGHGRVGGYSVEPRISNLFLQSSQPTPEAELTKRFLESCRQRELEYCYRVESLGRGNAPRLLYRVRAKDGHEDLVRGSTIGQMDLRSLRNDIVAVGDKMEVSNNGGSSPYAIIAPALLFDELEIKKENDTKEKLPNYPRPPVQ